MAAYTRMLHADWLLCGNGATENTREGLPNPFPDLSVLEGKKLAFGASSYRRACHLINIRPFQNLLSFTPLINGFNRWVANTSYNSELRFCRFPNEKDGDTYYCNNCVIHGSVVS